LSEKSGKSGYQTDTKMTRSSRNFDQKVKEIKSIKEESNSDIDSDNNKEEEK
jgi:hypothetical protein